MNKIPLNSWNRPIQWWQRFKFQLIVFSVLMSVLPLAVLGGYNVSVARENLLAAVTSHHEQSVIQVANDLSSLLSGLQHALGVFTSTGGKHFSMLPPEEQTNQLYAAMTHMPDVQGLAVVNHAGEQIARVSRFQVFDPQEPAPSLRSEERNALVEGKIHIGPLQLDQNKQPTFHLLVPFIHSMGSQVNGGVYATVSLRNIMEKISSISAGKGGYIFLIDGDGRLIGHEDFSQVLNGRDVGKSLPPVEMVKRAKTVGKPITRTYVSYTGQQVIGSYSAVAGTDWAVIAEQPISVALSPLQKLIRTFAFASGILIMLVLGISLLFGRKLTFALETLKEGMLRVVSGEVGHKVTVSYNDEIGQVLDAFNYLSQELYQKRQMEAVISQADRMASVGILAAGVAHEVNNPLATISLSVEDLLDRLKKESANDLYQSGELSTYLEAVQEQAQRCAGITGGLLDFARQREGTKVSVKIDELVYKTIGFLRYRLKKENIKLVLDLSTDLPEIVVDGSGVQQVLFNLCLNALDAMSAGDTLTIKVEFLRGHLLLSVSDTGTGIAAEHVPNIFDPFFTTKKPGQGTGLGLSVCYGIITRSGGHIEVETELNRGTTVNIRIPFTGEFNA
ncbi:MAG: signal transduction histidine kinase regulating C4-dicarboxylate transport system [Firmicutes bacterium]|nr:signal transduction histidine kinase regulating C4-dicarboxylate transport system [Bacillota bacterium]